MRLTAQCWLHNHLRERPGFIGAPAKTVAGRIGDSMTLLPG